MDYSTHEKVSRGIPRRARTWLMTSFGVICLLAFIWVYWGAMREIEAISQRIAAGPDEVTHIPYGEKVIRPKSSLTGPVPFIVDDLIWECTESSDGNHQFVAYDSIGFIHTSSVLYELKADENNPSHGILHAIYCGT